jgi:hypothetical protein
MILVDHELDRWIEKYNLIPDTYHCNKCKCKFETNIPVLTKNSVGLISSTHACGAEYYMAILKPRTKEALDFWNQII